MLRREVRTEREELRFYDRYDELLEGARMRSAIRWLAVAAWVVIVAGCLWMALWTEVP